MTKKTKPRIKLSFTGGISIVFSIFLFAMLLKNSSLASVEVTKALKLCTNMLIPSLFPLTVASEIMTNTGAIEKLTNRFSSPIAKMLGVKKTATVPYFLGLFGGYTSSCKSAIILYQSGKISKNDCESIIALSNMPSIAFLTGFVGAGIFQNSSVGWILWFITVLSSVILGLINKIFFRDEMPIYNPSKKTAGSNIGLSRITVGAIASSAYAMLIICACVVFFSVLISVLQVYFVQIPISNEVKNAIWGALEITNGVNGCSSIDSISHRALTCAFLIGWSGLCVHFQVISLCENTDISFKKYFIFKGLQGIICAALSYVIFQLKF